MQEFDLLEKCKVNQVQLDQTNSFLIVLQKDIRINIYSINNRSLISEDIMQVNSFLMNKNFIHSIDMRGNKIVKLNYRTLKIQAKFIKDCEETIIINGNLLYLRKREYFQNLKYLYLRDNNYKQIRRLKHPQSLGGNYDLIFDHDYNNLMKDFITCKNIQFKLDQLQLSIFSQNNISVLIQYCQSIEGIRNSQQSTFNLKIINNDQMIWNSPCNQYDINSKFKLIAFQYKDKKLIYISNLFNLQWQYINLEHNIKYFKILDNKILQVIYKNKMKIVIDVVKLNQFQF